MCKIYYIRICVRAPVCTSAGDRPLRTPMEQLVIYEMHVRGFTQDDSSNVSAPGTKLERNVEGKLQRQ